MRDDPSRDATLPLGEIVLLLVEELAALLVDGVPSSGTTVFVPRPAAALLVDGVPSSGTTVFVPRPAAALLLDGVPSSGTTVFVPLFVDKPVDGARKPVFVEAC